MNTIDASTSSNDIENDLKIVLKQDYYDLSDFAYFGSCSELIRASLTDILARFPGELAPAIEKEEYAVAYYSNSITSDGGKSITLEFGKYVKKDEYGNPIKDKENGGYEIGVASGVIEDELGKTTFDVIDEKGNSKLHVIGSSSIINIYDPKTNFTLIDDNDPKCPESGYTLTSLTNYPVVNGYPYNNLGKVQNIGGNKIEENDSEESVVWRPGNRITVSKMSFSNGKTYTIQVFCGNNKEIVYLTNNIEAFNGIHIKSANGELTPVISLQAAVAYYADSITGVGDRSTTLEFGQYVERKDGKPIEDEENGGYKIGVASNGDNIKVSEDKEGNTNLHVIDNPFGINIYNTNLPTEKTSENPLRYFCNDGYKEYTLIVDGDDNEDGYGMTSWHSYPVVNGYPYNNFGKVIGKNEKEKNCDFDNYQECSEESVVWCPGNRVAIVEMSFSNGTNLTIQVFCGNNKEPIYLTDNIEAFRGLHIRPSNKAFFEFWDSLDNFEKVLLNYKTDPLYNAQFQIIHENNFGYYREIESFEFPKRYGGYNINTSENEFGDYTNRLSTIAAFYDERFCDNLYRSLTHESIKNFDWTYTREYTPGDEHPYVEGGNKIQKTLRLFGREFDEIKSYIDNINNTNTVTYDEQSNLPDYFLTDVLELDGWDLRVITPFMLSQYYKDENDSNIPLDEDEEKNLSIDNILNNKFVDGKKDLHRAFSQDTLRMVIPYSKTNECYPDGYYATCDCDNHKMVYINATGATYYDKCANIIRERIRNYSSEEQYTMYDVNNEFMKRLKLNSRYILRHKGTIDGIEMLMGMFGFRSKRWFDALSDEEKMKYGALPEEEMKKYDHGLSAFSKCSESLSKSGFSPYDFELIEYSSFTKRIEEKWNAPHDMYNIDWINSTKLLTYTYSSNEGDVGYLPYQGIPVAYRNDDYNYCKKCSGTTTNKDEAYIDSDGNPVPVRYLYPKFNVEEEYDGNPYFQMNGGWLSRYIQNGSKRTNIMFDSENNIISNKDINASIHTETIRNIKTINTLRELLDIPAVDLTPNDVYYVKDLSMPYAIIDGKIYPINYDEDGKKYINLTVENGRISIGSVIFDSDERITVYNSSGGTTAYAIEDKEDGYELQAYIYSGDTDDKSEDAKSDNVTLDNTNKPPMFIASGRTGLGISSFSLFEDGRIYTGKEEDDEKHYTHYFKISDIYQSMNMSDVATPGGWKQLAETDADYHRVNSIKDYYKGNNPHSGNQSYDNGHEYFLYFKELFKYANENLQFDKRCYDGDIPYDDISKIGFSGLVASGDSDVNYDDNLIADNKVHYFGNYKKSNVKRLEENPYDIKIEDIKRYIYAYDDKGDKSFDEDLRGNYARRYGLVEKNKKDLTREDLSGVPGYNLSTKESMIDGFSGYTKDSVDKIPYIDTNTPIDASTNQIVNNKRLKMKIYLRNENWASNDGLCELKYLDEIVIPYITQMIPSSTIFEVQYVERFKYVDLGLPSGTLWATKNVGAAKPSDAGLYFQWGDTKGYTKEQVGKDKQFNWDDYKWKANGEDKTYIKYTTPGEALELEDDAAHAYMGGDWHMPTPEQIQELIDYTTTAWTTSNGSSGMTFTSRKDESKLIFIPAAGGADNGSIGANGTAGSFWSPVLRTGDASYGQGLDFNSGGASLDGGYRNSGLSVRGVIG